MILDGFTSLLRNNHVNKISMKAIAEAGQVTRMTLYRHFNNKEDIILYAFEKTLNQFANQYQSTGNNKMYDMLLFRFKAIQHSPYSSLLIENNYIYKLFKIIREKSNRMFELFDIQQPDIWTLRFVGGGIDAITEKWMLEGMIIPYEEIANNVFNIIIKLRSN